MYVEYAFFKNTTILFHCQQHGARKRGRPALTYVDQLQNDTGLSIAELKNIMENRKEWMKLVNGVRVRSK